MVTIEIRNSLKQALTELRIAEHELNRPHEDVVTLSVCYSARHSMNPLLRLFLLSNDIDHNEEKSLSELHAQCVKIDKEFSSIDISTINCNELNRTERDGKYCMTIDKVHECVVLANRFKTIILNKLKINESEMN